ncbi:MAG: putative manganese-dependent inorganic diphosphatase [Spirochaetaceae bacterium]
MAEVFIAGHRSPDMDCTCASTAYARLKHAVDPTTTYTPIRSGALADQIRDVYEQAGVSVPIHVESIEPTVADVVKPYDFCLAPDDPVLRAFELVRERTISAIPVCERDGSFTGVVGVNEIASYASAVYAGERPEYRFWIHNFDRVLPGRFLRTGEPEEFVAPIAIGAMPVQRSFERMQRLSRPPLLIVGNRPEILRYAAERDFPAIVITGLEGESELEIDFSGYSGTVYLSETDTAESIRLLRLSSEVGMVTDRSVPRLEDTTPFDEAKGRLLGSDYRGFPVFREGRFLGMVTRRSFIERPRPTLILVDHNELDQAVEGAEYARVLEIIDHHRLDAPKTTEPISVRTRPVGSTCTMVWQEYRSHGVEIPADVAILLLAGILSDTVNLQSPTATEIDRLAIESLEQLTGLTRDEQTRRMFSRLKALQERDPHEVVTADFKVYEENGLRIGIGQAEVTTLLDTHSYTERIKEALEDTAREQGLSWTMLMITDVVKGDSLLLTNGYSEGDRRLVYPKVDERMYRLPGVLSRKKQLLPEVVRVAHELAA